MSLSDFEILKQLGKGAFGSVSLVRRKKDSQTYAMKRIRLIPLSEKEREVSLNEIRILASLNHQNIIAYKEAFLDDSSKTLNIIMEYAEGGDIDSKIKENKQKNLYFSETTIWFWLMQLLEALLYLHSKKVIHRDIKGANIFLTKNNIVKLGDLGVSKIAQVGFAQTQTGTPYYCAPEIWRERPYTDKCDIWSVGCILYEICALRPPFRGTSLKDLCANVERGRYLDIPNIYSQDLKDVIRRMLVVNERDRPSIDQLMSWDTLRKRRMFNSGNNEKNSSLIQTIRMPRNMKDVNAKLPKARYGEKEMMEGADCNQGKKNSEDNDKKVEVKKDDKQINKYEYIKIDYKKFNYNNPYGNNQYPFNNPNNGNNNNNKYNYPDYKNYQDRFNNNNNYHFNNNNVNNNYQPPPKKEVKPIIDDRNKYAYLNKFDNNMKIKKEYDKPVKPNIGNNNQNINYVPYNYNQKKYDSPYQNNNNNLYNYNQKKYDNPIYNNQNENIYKNDDYYIPQSRKDNYNYYKEQPKYNNKNYYKEQPKYNNNNNNNEEKDDLTKAVDEILNGIEMDETRIENKKYDPYNDSLWGGAYKEIIINEKKKINENKKINEKKDIETNKISSEKNRKIDRYRDLFSSK